MSTANELQELLDSDDGKYISFAQRKVCAEMLAADNQNDLRVRYEQRVFAQLLREKIHRRKNTAL